jgi:hypothetical protein
LLGKLRALLNRARSWKLITPSPLKSGVADLSSEHSFVIFLKPRPKLILNPLSIGYISGEAIGNRQEAKG